MCGPNKTTAHNSQICTDVEVIRYRNSRDRYYIHTTICSWYGALLQKRVYWQQCWLDPYIHWRILHYLFFLFLNELCNVEEWASSPLSFLTPWLFLCSFPPSKNPSSLWKPRKNPSLWLGIDKNDLVLQSVSNSSLPSPYDPYRILCTYKPVCVLFIVVVVVRPF